MDAELEQARRRVAQLEQQLALAGQALEDFTYSVSHDLRASLRHVTSYLKIVREDLGDGLDPTIDGHLDTAAQAAAQMGRLMDGLMVLSRAGQAELQPSDIDLAQLVSVLRGQLAPEPPRQVEWHIAPDLPVVHADLALLGQALTHLLSNALKFTRDCAVAQIEIGWERLDAGHCELWIRDNGVGFDTRLQDRLFRVFQRLHSPRQYEGIGIGLAFARRVVERHGGSIRARGDLAPGCQITLTLPLAAQPMADAHRTWRA